MKPKHSDVTVRAHAGLRQRLPGECEAVSSILSRVGDKWTVLIVMMLADGPKRFNELKRMIGGVSQRMLTLTLRGLERDGMVIRTLYPTIPPRVEYELSELGQSLRRPVEALGNWAFSNLPSILGARDAFDKRELEKSPARSAAAMPAPSGARSADGVRSPDAARSMSRARSPDGARLPDRVRSAAVAKS